jgi:hypothetical protein
MRTSGPSEGESLTGLVSEVVGGLGHLVALHVKLAKVELTSELKTVAGAAGLSAAMVVPLVVGYALVMGAAGWALGRWLGWGPAGGLAVVGLLNLVVGGVGAWAGAKRVESVKVGDRTSDELRRSVEVLTTRSLTNPEGSDSHVS